MSKNEKKSYLAAIRRRYKKANKANKSKILDEFCAVCGYNRKYAIRRLSIPLKQHKQPPGRKPRYEHDKLLAPLKIIWLASDQLCSKRLKMALPDWLPAYEKEHGILDDSARGQLLSLSPATIDRVLKPVRVKHLKGKCGTKPGRLLKNQIPIKTDNWDITQPGFVEADTVAHCGNSLAGDFIWSLTISDIFSGWTENRAVWNKGAQGVVKQIKYVEKHLPFELLGFDCDNGSEFLNYHLLRYFAKRKPTPVQFTRSRPYHKNDNAHVEQKNWTHVRQLLGYDRLDNPKQVDLVNRLYTLCSLYQNHFRPVMKLIEKTKINSKYKKRYDTPKTPFQRLIDSQHISSDTKQKLKKQHLQLNPFALKREIEIKLTDIFKLTRLPPF